MIEVSSPFPFLSAPRIWQWSRKYHDVLFDDETPREEDPFIEYWMERIGREPSWAVSIDGELGGLILATPSQGSMRICSIFKPSAWPRAGEALAQVFAELFEANVEEIHSPAFQHSKALIAVLKSLGAQHRAKYYGAAKIGGRSADVVLLVTTKESFNHAVSTNCDGSVGGGERDRVGPQQPVEENQADNPHEHSGDVRPGRSAAA